MSTSNSLNVLTPKLNPIGQRRLFEFLDVVDTNTAARFRGWLSAATDGEVGAAAVLLNRSSHGREFAKWWQDRDTTPNSAAQSHAPQRSFSSGAGRHVRSRRTRNGGIP